jgi:predicted DNA-binding transcriptional regulator AlpA
VNGYAVIIRADVTPPLDERQLAAVSAEAGGTIAYDSGTGVLRFTVSTPDPDADAVSVLAYGADTITRAVRLAGAAASIREGRVLSWEDFEAETFRPATPRGGLAGVAEVTEILGVSRARVYQLMEGHEDFPKPAADLKGGPVWDRTEVETWERGWDRKRTGRPRKTA